MVQAIKTKIINATIELLEKEDYNSLSLVKVARKSKIKKSQVQDLFIDIDSIIYSYLDNVDIKMINQVKKDANLSDMHDIIFNLVMARIDHYQENRTSIINLLSKKSSFRYKYLIRSARLAKYPDILYQETEDSAPKLTKITKEIGFLFIYKQSIFFWLENEDTSKVMSHLDGLLDKGSTCFGYIKTPLNILDDYITKMQN